MALAAQYCVPTPMSSWCWMIGLTCAQELFIWFREGGTRFHGVYIPGGPGVCCLYPGTTQAHFELMLFWASKCKFVHEFLYKMMPYIVIAPPCPAQGCSVTTNCCDILVPATLHVTLIDQGGCGCMQTSYVVQHDGAGSWVYSGTVCGLNFAINLSCILIAGSYYWRLGITCGTITPVNTEPAGSCDPIVNIVFAPVFSFGGGGCCNGSVLATVTE